MGRHSAQASIKTGHLLILGLSILSATAPIALLFFVQPSAHSESTTSLLTKSLSTKAPELPLTEALQAAEQAISPTSKKKRVVEKDADPEPTVRRRVPTTKTTTTTTERATVAQPRTTTTTTQPKKTTTTTTTTTKKPTTPPVTTISGGRAFSIGLKPSAARAAEEILRATGFKGVILGVGNRPNNPDSDHPRGYAVDFMTTDLAMGNAIKRYALNNQARLGVKYVIWQEPAHYNHVHISFVG